MMMRRSIRGGAAVIVAAAVMVGCAPRDDAPGSAGQAASVPAGAEATVTIRDRAFTPDSITVTAGTTVSWVNEDDAGHTITHGEDGAPGEGVLFDEPLSAGQTVTFTFDEPGEYPVTCTIHPDMQMVVIVEEAEG
jgi:plastocyanin